MSLDTKFAYWIPNVSGGLVISKWPMKTDWSFEYNKQLARTAEQVGFEYGLAQARFFGSYGADKQLEAITTATALAAVTEKLHVIAAVHPGLWHPGPIANVIATGDHISNGRFHLNVVSGWFKGEYAGFGEPWLDHDERYARSEEFIQVLKGLWTQPSFSFDGRFYRIKDAPCEPKPIQAPHPSIFQGGNSVAARRMAARVSDWLFLNGGSLADLKKLIDSTKAFAKEAGREPPKFGVNAFVIYRDTEEAAHEELENVIKHATKDAVEAFRDEVRQAGKASPEGEGMWANSDFRNLIQYNDGFKTGLIGTKEQIVERIRQLHAIGVDLVLTGFLHYSEDLPRFGREIIPAVREAGPLSPEETAALLEQIDAAPEAPVPVPVAQA